LCKRANRKHEIFNTFKPTSYTIKYIHYFAKQDDTQRYHTFWRLHNIQADEQIVADTLNIDRRYLLDKDKLLDDRNNETICDSINTLFNDNSIKSLSIKSPYDTGKTQLLKQVMTKFKQKRVLWLSYRKTLTYDIYSNFNRFGFKSYLDHHYNADRIIIQLESLLNIDNGFIQEEGIEINSPSYDLVIIDEIESILNQFSSEQTFKGKSEITFEFIVEILKASNKIIALDGDLGNRSFVVLNKLSESIHICNTTNFNTFKLKTINDNKEFQQMVINDFKEGKKLFIPCMPNGFAEDIEKNLTTECPDKSHKIQIYNSNQSDKIKEVDMKTIMDTWSKLDCIITTPTIDA